MFLFSGGLFWWVAVDGDRWAKLAAVQFLSLPVRGAERCCHSTSFQRELAIWIHMSPKEFCMVQNQDSLVTEATFMQQI